MMTTPKLTKRHVMTALTVAFAVAALPVFGGSAAQASDYPDRTVTLVVPFSAGGTTDGVARIVAAQLEEQTGQTWLIDNRAGAGGTIGAGSVAEADNDGYTLLMSSTGIVSIAPHVRNVPYEPAKDFTPISMVGFSNGVLAVHPSVPVQTVQDLVDYGTENPASLFFASGGVGSIAHLFGEMFKARAGIEMQHVPFGGSAPALTDVIAGRAQVIFDTGAVNPVREGQLTGLAVLGAEQSPLLPDLPTLRETGFGEDMLSWFGILAPSGVPDDVVTALAAQIEEALASEEVSSRLAAAGITARFEGPEQFAASMERDYAGFGAVIERIGIEPQ